ncbi:hypothetical protein WME89_26555 [Sorangium sp. So ce321]|uniref:hypothetical protein n=1 Tax=Sorangium sp. So ce321 TaxID=3133300 RepID=UPI003F60C93E
MRLGRWFGMLIDEHDEPIHAGYLELRAGGAAPVHAMAIAFDGKVVRVRAGDPG